ncbi:MAG TPA: hypothetical protein VF651_00585 [Gammaproteobacteria bacterium]
MILFPANWPQAVSGHAAALMHPRFKSWFHGTWLPYALALVLLVAEMLTSNKIWATNDDIGMAMISGGFGIAAHPSAGLIFSNVIWGWIVMHLPDAGGVTGYALATYGLLFASFLAIAASLQRLHASPWLGAAILLLMYSPVLVVPQFTIVAGYVAIAGLAVFVAWRESHSLVTLSLAGALLFLASIVRMTEFVFVLGVACPLLLAVPRLLPSRAAFSGERFRRTALFAAAMLVLLSSAYVANKAYYSSDEWKPFRDINPVRVQFTDYRAGKYFSLHPESLEGSKISRNDIQLIQQWFYQDTRVFDGAAFSRILAGLPWQERLDLNARKYPHVLRNFDRDQFKKLFWLIPLLVLLNFRRDPRTAAAFGLFLLGMGVLYLLGRGGVTRVYIPPLAAISVLSLMAFAPETRWRMHLAGVAGLVLLATPMVVHAFNPKASPTARFAREVCQVSHQRLLVIWGRFPYRNLYHPGDKGPACDPDLYSLGSMQLAPYTLDNLEHYTGTRSLADALIKGQPVYVFTTLHRLENLQQYFVEHYSLALAGQEIMRDYHLNLFEVHIAGPASGKALPKIVTKGPDDAQESDEQDDDDDEN